MKKINIIEVPRGTGITSYIIEAALNNPRVIIVGFDQRITYELKREYVDKQRQRISETNETFDVEPFFITLERYSEVIAERRKQFLSRPVLFDNSCYTSQGLLIKSE